MKGKTLLLRLIAAVAILATVFAIAPSTDAQSGTITYFYVATAADVSSRESVFSNEVPAAVPLQGSHTVALTCTEPASSAVGFNFYRSTVSGGPYARQNAALTTACAFTDTFSPPAPPVLAPAKVN